MDILFFILIVPVVIWGMNQVQKTCDFDQFCAMKSDGCTDDFIRKIMGDDLKEEWLV
jgi:hypothetical protein